MNITAHRISLLGNVQLQKDLISIKFPFPLQTESGLTIQTETGADIAVGGPAVAIPLIGGVVSPQLLHVTTED